MAVKKKYDRNVLGRGLDNIGTGKGRGLDALIDTSDVHVQGSSNLSEIALTMISPNPNQPRTDFDEAALQELAASIREIGLVTPITLRQMGENEYQIIAGERRWRAATLAGLTTIPAYIRTAEDEKVMEMALISSRVGKSRTSITNYMRLLKLPAQIQIALKNKDIDMGHARALLAIDSPSTQLKLFKEVQRNGYSVRKVEELVQKLKNGESIQTVKKPDSQLSLEYSILRDRLSDLFKVKVQMTCSSQGKGKISIPFANEDELEHVMNIIDKIKN